MSNVYAEMKYKDVYHDLSPTFCDSENMLDCEYIYELHTRLDEWLLMSGGDGYFIIKGGSNEKGE